MSVGKKLNQEENKILFFFVHVKSTSTLQDTTGKTKFKSCVENVSAKKRFKTLQKWELTKKKIVLGFFFNCT